MSVPSHAYFNEQILSEFTLDPCHTSVDHERARYARIYFSCLTIRAARYCPRSLGTTLLGDSDHFGLPSFGIYSYSYGYRVCDAADR